MGRAKTGLADGYRFPAFAPHCQVSRAPAPGSSSSSSLSSSPPSSPSFAVQDFDPSADHYANVRSR